MSQDRVILQNTGHPDHLMINQDHLTSPLTGHLTNHPMSHLTSPLTGHLTSPFTGHPMSHLTGHPTSLDPLMSLDHLTDHIERKNFSFHLPVVRECLWWRFSIWWIHAT